MRFAESRRAIPRRTGLQVFIWWVIVRTIVRIGLSVLYRHRCYGRSNVPRKGPAIYIANHQSHYDPPIVGSLVGAYTSLARSTLFPAKPWGWIFDRQALRSSARRCMWFPTIGTSILGGPGVDGSSTRQVAIGTSAILR